MRIVKRIINYRIAMTKADDDESSDSVELASSGTGSVAIRRDVLPEFDSLPDQTKGRFRRIMQMWCEGHTLTPEMLNRNEGRSPKKNIMIQAFKAFKIRLYGFVGGHRFLIVEIDPVKKQNKADPRILERAKRRADGM